MSTLPRSQPISRDKDPSPPAPLPQGEGGTGDFEEQANGVLQRLRAAVAALIDHVAHRPGGRIERAADLERALALPTKLAWQVYRIAHSTNPLAEVEQVPGAAGMRQVLKAAMKAEAPKERLKAVTEAMEDFDNLVRHHAGDRKTFETMARGVAAGVDSPLDVKLRKTAFRENSRVWGVQVRTALWAGIYVPGGSAALLDAVSLRGMHEIRRLRSDAPFRLSMVNVKTGSKEDVPQSGLEMGNGALGDRPTILTEFCTQPIPEFTTQRRGVFIETYLPPGAVGKQDAPTYHLASASRDIPWQDDPADPALALTSDVAVTKPCERFLVDMFVHGSVLGDLVTKAAVLGSLNRLGQPPTRDDDREGEILPVEVEPVIRGRALEAVQTPHVPRYREMFEHVCERMGWDAKAFALFRWEFRYPILGSVLYTQVRIPEYGKMRG